MSLEPCPSAHREFVSATAAPVERGGEEEGRKRGREREGERGRVGEGGRERV